MDKKNAVPVISIPFIAPHCHAVIHN